MTKRLGIIQPNVIPKWPAREHHEVPAMVMVAGGVPVTSGKKNVVETDAHTPMMENANPIVCRG